ncbi:MAG: hypothetical protein RR818_04570 [Citrobacter sp.]
MNPTIYAVVNNDGYVTALVNALLLPEIVNQANAVPAPAPDPFPQEGKAWRWVAEVWAQVPDPQVAASLT